LVASWLRKEKRAAAGSCGWKIREGCSDLLAEGGQEERLHGWACLDLVLVVKARCQGEVAEGFEICGCGVQEKESSWFISAEKKSREEGR
jgi:hypothetical protein